MIRLTDKRRAILAFIGTEIRATGICPSIREICDRFGLKGTNGIIEHLQALERYGYLHRTRAGRARSIVLTQQGWHALDMLPLPEAPEQSAVRVEDVIALAHRLSHVDRARLVHELTYEMVAVARENASANAEVSP